MYIFSRKQITRQTDYYDSKEMQRKKAAFEQRILVSLKTGLVIEEQWQRVDWNTPRAQMTSANKCWIYSIHAMGVNDDMEIVSVEKPFDQLLNELVAAGEVII
jgi:hypothetical protein